MSRIMSILSLAAVLGLIYYLFVFNKPAVKPESKAEVVMEQLPSKPLPVECTKKAELEEQFFPEIIVEKVLTEKKIPVEIKKKMIADLKFIDSEIHDLVQQDSQKIDPDPFKVADGKAIYKLYRDRLLRLLNEVFAQYGYVDKKQNAVTFYDIQNARGQMLEKCKGFGDNVKMEKGQIPIKRKLTPEQWRQLIPEADPSRVQKE